MTGRKIINMYEHDILDKVLAYVDSHIKQRMSLQELSDVSGYSPFYFSRLFSEAMGMPITGYIRIRKPQHAIVSLLEGNKVLDIALMYSFDSHEGFTRSFTQLFGSTPSTVRKFLTSYTVPKYAVPNIAIRSVDLEEMKTIDLQYGVHQLIYEVLGNSLDEARAGYCTRIEIVLLPDGKIKIIDNGRGLPLSKDLNVSKEVLDKILTGSPITNAEYSQMGDLVQVGLQTVNSLCDTLQITINREGNKFQQDYIRGIAQHDLRISNMEYESGTEIIMRPDKAIFREIVIFKQAICNWLDEKAADIVNLDISVCNVNE